MRLAIDTSALIACVFDEPEAQSIEQLLFKNDILVIAPVLLEATMVLAGRGVTNPIETVSEAEIDYKLIFVPFDEHMIRIAQEAFLRYGKGRHPAELNFGDCMSYAAAKALDIPLLYKGDDFAQTDIESALALFSSE